MPASMRGIVMVIPSVPVSSTTVSRTLLSSWTSFSCDDAALGAAPGEIRPKMYAAISLQDG